MAFQIINDLKIKCSNETCPWIGTLDQAQSHIPNCRFNNGNLPGWYDKYVQSRDDVGDKKEEKKRSNAQ